MDVLLFSQTLNKAGRKANVIVDETYKEVAHHKQALIDAGYKVCTINWDNSFIKDLKDNKVDLAFYEQLVQGVEQRLNDEEMNNIKEFAENAYRAIGFKDYGRIDTISTREGPYLFKGNSFAGLMCTLKEKQHGYSGFMVVASNMNSA